MKAVFLKLVNIMLGFLERFAGEHAFALLMNLEHVELRFLFCPAENHLEDVGDVIHQVDRIIPANHLVARLELVLWLGLFLLNGLGQNRTCISHLGKIGEPFRLFKSNLPVRQISKPERRLPGSFGPGGSVEKIAR
jgi:hypothetical protein